MQEENNEMRANFGYRKTLSSKKNIIDGVSSQPSSMKGRVTRSPCLQSTAGPRIRFLSIVADVLIFGSVKTEAVLFERLEKFDGDDACRARLLA